MKCDTCNRDVPNEKFKTEDGCIWCDADYHIKRILNERKKLQNN